MLLPLTCEICYTGACIADRWIPFIQSVVVHTHARYLQFRRCILHNPFKMPTCISETLHRFRLFTCVLWSCVCVVGSYSHVDEFVHLKLNAPLITLGMAPPWRQQPAAAALEEMSWRGDVWMRSRNWVKTIWSSWEMWNLVDGMDEHGCLMRTEQQFQEGKISFFHQEMGCRNISASVLGCGILFFIINCCFRHSHMFYFYRYMDKEPTCKITK